MKNLTKLAFLVVLFGSLVFSCEKIDMQEEMASDENVSSLKSITEAVPEICGELRYFDLIAEKVVPEEVLGNIEIGNDGSTLFITANATAPGYMLLEFRVFAGAMEDVPYWPYGPYSEAFPYVKGLYGQAITYTMEIPLAELPEDCFIVLIKVKFRLFDDQGNIIKSDVQTWAGYTEPPFSEQFPNQKYFEYCVAECGSPCDLDGYKTFTQGGWGTHSHGHNPGTYRDANFKAAYPNGLVIGHPDKYTITLTSSKAVENLLPTGGKPAALKMSFVDPKGMKNVFVGQVTALALNIGFDDYDPDFAPAGSNLGDLVISAKEFKGYTIRQVLDEANMALAGMDTEHSLKSLAKMVGWINIYFDENPDKKSHELPDIFACP